MVSRTSGPASVPAIPALVSAMQRSYARASADGGPRSHSSSGKPGCQMPASTGRRVVQDPPVTVVTPIVTSDLSAQPCRLSDANSALNWSGG
jgi:hypothetical protein